MAWKRNHTQLTARLVTALAKGDERYLVLCDEANVCKAVETIARWACDEDLSLTIQEAHAMIDGLEQA